MLVWLAEKILGVAAPEDGHRADMYLPDFLLAMALVLLAGGTGFAIACIFWFSAWLIAAAVICLALGAGAVLCWKNQTIRMINDEEFVYTTFLGNDCTLRFADIRGARQNSDSITLLVADRKVHIESMAILSDRLTRRINQELARKAQ